MNKTIAVIRGDGIGPEIVGEAIGVLDAVAEKFGHSFTYVEAPMGGCAIDAFGDPLPESSLQTCLLSDSALLGAVGGVLLEDSPRRVVDVVCVHIVLGVEGGLRPVDCEE